MEKDSKSGSHDQTDSLQVRRARIQTLTTYEILESELLFLTEKPSGSICLYLASIMLSAFCSFLSVLLTNPPPSKSIRLTVFYIVITVGTGLAGIILLCIALASWRQSHRERSRVVEEIKKRLPPAKPVQKMATQGEDQQVNLSPNLF